MDLLKQLINAQEILDFTSHGFFEFYRKLQNYDSF
jgi:hypothetical protein